MLKALLRRWVEGDQEGFQVCPPNPLLLSLPNNFWLAGAATS